MFNCYKNFKGNIFYVASDSPPPASSAFGFDIGSGQRRFFEKEDSDASSEEESESEEEE